MKPSSILSTSYPQTLSATTLAPSLAILPMISSATQSPLPSMKHSWITSQASSPITGIPTTSLLMICISLASYAASASASSAASLASSLTMRLAVVKSSSSRGSLRLKPQVMAGLEAKTATSYTACRAMFSNSRPITRRTTMLQRYSSMQRSSPPRCWSYWASVTLSTTMLLTYRYSTFEAMKSTTEEAIRYSLSAQGQINRRVRKPRTKACIFLSRARPSFLTRPLVSKCDCPAREILSY